MCVQVPYGVRGQPTWISSLLVPCGFLGIWFWPPGLATSRAISLAQTNLYVSLKSPKVAAAFPENPKSVPSTHSRQLMITWKSIWCPPLASAGTCTHTHTHTLRQICIRINKTESFFLFKRKNKAKENSKTCPWRGFHEKQLVPKQRRIYTWPYMLLRWVNLNSVY